MAQDHIKLGEQFSAQVIKSSTEQPVVKPRHRVIGYGLIGLVVGSLVWLLWKFIF